MKLGDNYKESNLMHKNINDDTTKFGCTDSAENFWVRLSSRLRSEFAPKREFMPRRV
jgi:hypothetical protein